MIEFVRLTSVPVAKVAALLGEPRGFGELGFDHVVLALPLTRHADRVVARFGFRPDGEAEHGGIRFRRYRSDRSGRS